MVAEAGIKKIDISKKSHRALKVTKYKKKVLKMKKKKCTEKMFRSNFDF